MTKGARSTKIARLFRSVIRVSGPLIKRASSSSKLWECGEAPSPKPVVRGGKRLRFPWRPMGWHFHSFRLGYGSGSQCVAYLLICGSYSDIFANASFLKLSYSIMLAVTLASSIVCFALSISSTSAWALATSA